MMILLLVGEDVLFEKMWWRWSLVRAGSDNRSLDCDTRYKVAGQVC